MSQQIKYFSTFSGIGGFELGIQYAYESLRHAHGGENGRIEEDTTGDEGQGLLPTEGKNASTEKRSASERASDMPHERPLCVGYSEIDKYATQIYQKHFPNHTNYGDITKIDAECLPDFDVLVGGFPCQSFSIAGKRKGFEDTRGTMFFEIARIVKEKRPCLLVLENVRGLLSHDNGNTFLTIIATIDELGYDTQWQVLNSKNHGVPQNRERVFIIGHLRGTSRPQVFPIGESNQVNIKQYVHSGTLTSRYPASQREGTYIEEARKTGSALRKLTPVECERLQGFPDNWTEGISDTQRYKCCGNAVTVNVVRDIMMKIL